MSNPLVPCIGERALALKLWFALPSEYEYHLDGVTRCVTEKDA